MKKYIFILIGVLLLGIPLFSSTRDMQSIKTVADNFIGSYIPHTEIGEAREIAGTNGNSAYLFNLEPTGFVVITADNDLRPVIAYSLTNKLEDSEREINPFLEIISEDIAKRLEYYRLNPSAALPNHELWNRYLGNDIISRDFQQWPPAGSTPTDGWVETRWNQSGVYNQYCPIDNDGARSVVGCVATAMAMIVDFHKYVGDINFSNYDDYSSGYDWPYIYIDDDHADRDFPSFPELNSLMDDVKTHYTNGEPLTGSDKGALSYACGVSIHMDYSAQGSGTQTSYVASALRNKFDFDTAQAIDNYGSSFYNQLRDNNIAMKPVEISIYTSGYNDGHAIICDGYNTDDYYHLNYGWGDSNSSCWYDLPSGMPYNYSIISDAVVNIEGGAAPMQAFGLVTVPQGSPQGTFITLEGENFFTAYVQSSDGTFDFPAIWPGTYTATALLEGRFFYQTQEVTLTASNNFIQFNLSEFDAVTGNVQAPIEPTDTTIKLYQDGNIVYSGIADANGNFSISEVFPGEYLATASLGGRYFEQKDVEITAENQTINFDLEEYSGDIGFSYAAAPTDIYHLIPNYTMTCAIKIAPEDFVSEGNDIIAKVRFLAPIEPTEGEISAQIWCENTLLWEKEIPDFQKGEWLEETADFYQINLPDKFYYVGYKIHSIGGDFAYHDDGPRVTGKGAFIHTSGWTEPSVALNDYNFCIDAIFIAQDYGTITGNISLTGEGDVKLSSLFSDNFITHPNDNGDYILNLKAGEHIINAACVNYETSSSAPISITDGQTIENVNFILQNTGIGENTQPGIVTKLLNNYPNPFNPSTTIYFETSNLHENMRLEIYNVRGQKIKEFDLKELKNGINQVVWNGKDENDNSVSSGVYFYKLSTGKYHLAKKMILLK